MARRGAFPDRRLAAEARTPRRLDPSRWTCLLAGSLTGPQPGFTGPERAWVPRSFVGRPALWHPAPCRPLARPAARCSGSKGWSPCQYQRCFPGPVLPAGRSFGWTRTQRPSDPRCSCRTLSRQSADHSEHGQLPHFWRPGLRTATSPAWRAERSDSPGRRRRRDFRWRRYPSSPLPRALSHRRCLRPSPFQRGPMRRRCRCLPPSPCLLPRSRHSRRLPAPGAAERRSRRSRR